MFIIYRNCWGKIIDEFSSLSDRLEALAGGQLLRLDRIHCITVDINWRHLQKRLLESTTALPLGLWIVRWQKRADWERRIQKGIDTRGVQSKKGQCR